MIAQLAEMAYRKAGQMFFCVQKDARVSFQPIGYLTWTVPPFR